jgi:hypothetical protein
MRKYTVELYTPSICLCERTTIFWDEIEKNFPEKNESQGSRTINNERNEIKERLNCYFNRWQSSICRTERGDLNASKRRCTILLRFYFVLLSKNFACELLNA